MSTGIFHADFIIKKGSIKGNSDLSNGVDFDVNNDGVDELALDPSGNVGLGVTSPSANLHVAGNLNLTGNIIGGLNKGLIGWWSFDEGTGATAADHSGLGNNGTLMNSPNWLNGVFGQSLEFNGSNQYVEIQDFQGHSTKSITVSCWVKLQSHKNWNFFAELETTGDHWLLWTNTTGNAKFRVTKGGTLYPITSTNTIPLNRWVHLTGTYHSPDLNLYINGVFSGNNSIADAPINSSGNVLISGVDGSYSIDGQIDDVRIYNRALSASEINELYRAKASYYTHGGTISGNTIFSGNLSVATLNLDTTTAPSSPQTGDLYSTGSNLMFRNSAGVWVSVIDATDSVWNLSSGNLSYDGGNIGIGSLSGAEVTVDNQSASANILDLYDNTTLALTVQDGGNIGVGTSAPSSKLDVSGNVAISSDLTLSADLTMSGHILPSSNNIYNVGSTDYAWRAIYSKDYVVLSDRRRKTEIQPLGSATEILKKLRPVNYHWINNPGQREIGLIAQEVLEVLPEAVAVPKKKGGLMGVKYQAFVPILIQVEKEQAAVIEKKSKDFMRALKKLQSTGRSFR